MSTIEPSPSDALWTEPESPANSDTPPQYPYNNVQQTESGHAFEMDDTPTRERIRLQHRFGTFIEMHPNGDEVHKVYGDGYEITINNKNVLVKGTCNITVEGDCNMHILGNKNERIDGDYNLEVRGTLITRARENCELYSDKNMTIGANSGFGGSLYLQAGEQLYLASDLNVAGSISCDMLNAESRVNAGTGVFAGPMGFVSGTGGLSLGFPSPTAPIAVPGCINVVGSIDANLPITSKTLVTAPVGKFSIMQAVLMTDTVNKALFNAHVHIGNRGFPTSTSLVSMV